MRRLMRHRLVLSLFAVSMVALFVLTGNVAAGGKSAAKPGGMEVAADKTAFFDSRQAPAAQLKLDARAAALDNNPPAATANLRDSLGVEGFAHLDPLTGTVQSVGRTDGFLTGPSSASASSIALGYVTKNASAFGLTGQGLNALSLRQDYVSIDGTHHLSYVQKIDGIQVFGNGVKVNVTKDGQVINVVGSPLANTSVEDASPSIGAGEAIAQSRLAVGLAPGANKSDSAGPVWFRTLGGTRLAYETTTGSGAQLYQSVVDAQTGKVMYRRSLVNNANGNVLDYYPNAAHGGTFHTVNLNQHGWLKKNAQTLSGPNVHEYSDVNDNNTDDSNENTVPGVYTMTTFNPSACVPGFPCSWDPETANSWQTNETRTPSRSSTSSTPSTTTSQRRRSASPTTAGNFEGDDPVLGENARRRRHRPATCRTATTSTTPTWPRRPTASRRRMQMYLFHQPRITRSRTRTRSSPPTAATRPTSSTTSTRTACPTASSSTQRQLDARQRPGRRDGRGVERLVRDGLPGRHRACCTDTAAAGELRVGNYVGWRQRPDPHAAARLPGRLDLGQLPGRRTRATRAATPTATSATSSAVPRCTPTARSGARRCGTCATPLGSKTAEYARHAGDGAVARPTRPMLDERNSILQADLVDNGGKNHNTIWTVFAHRGMGYFAGSLDGDDSQPGRGLLDCRRRRTRRRAPSPGTSPTRTPALPIAGAVVAFGGHDSGFAGRLRRRQRPQRATTP